MNCFVPNNLCECSITRIPALISIHLKSEIQNFTKQRLTKINMLDLIKVLKTKIFYSHNLEL